MAVGFSFARIFAYNHGVAATLGPGPIPNEKCDNSRPMEMPLQIAILAAGEGKRMRSALPKVLHLLGGRPLLDHVLGTSRSLEPKAICVVHSNDGGALRRRFPENDLAWALQDPPAGTGDALKRALATLSADGVTLVLFGADPLARPETLREVVERARKGALSLLTIDLDDPTGYGRIVRNDAGQGDRDRGTEGCDAGATRRARDQHGRHGGAHRGLHPLAGKDRQS